MAGGPLGVAGGLPASLSGGRPANAKAQISRLARTSRPYLRTSGRRWSVATVAGPASEQVDRLTSLQSERTRPARILARRAALFSVDAEPATGRAANRASRLRCAVALIGPVPPVRRITKEGNCWGGRGPAHGDGRPHSGLGLPSHVPPERHRRPDTHGRRTTATSPACLQSPPPEIRLGYRENSGPSPRGAMAGIHMLPVRRPGSGRGPYQCSVVTWPGPRESASHAGLKWATADRPPEPGHAARGGEGAAGGPHVRRGHRLAHAGPRWGNAFGLVS
jgi:hypothetical protein